MTAVLAPILLFFWSFPQIIFSDNISRLQLTINLKNHEEYQDLV